MGQQNQLLRVLGVVFGLAAVVGGVVGQGILRTPGTVAQASGSVAVIAGLWILGGVLALIAALPYAELGAAIPRAGGPIAYAERAFGPTARAATGYAQVLTLISSLGVVAFVVGEFLVRLGVGGGSLGPVPLGLGVLLTAFVLNAAGTRASGALQVALSTVKGLVLIALVIVLFAQPGAAPEAAPVAAHGGFAAFATAMLLIVGTYAGWGDVVVFGEEIENPARDVPRALFGGIALVGTLYVMVNLAVFHVITPASAAGSEFAAADAAGGALGENADIAFTLFGVATVWAITVFITMSSARVVFAAARSGMLPSWFDRVDSRGTPLRAMLLSTLAAGAFLASGTYLALAATSTALAQGVVLMVSLASIALMRREPGLVRPFRIPAYGPLIALVVALNIALLAIFVWTDPVYGLAGFALVAVLTLGYRLLSPPKPLPANQISERDSR